MTTGSTSHRSTLDEDVFEKTRQHSRIDQLKAARESGYMPYFRPLTSGTGPTVRMEGRDCIMLGANNYLGLTAHPLVIDGAREALERYGTGLTGSRFLNGTLELHEQLERELADWLGTEDAIVFTTGHQANLGALGTLLAPGDTVIVDSADHASILDGCILSRAKVRSFRHGRLDRLEKMLARARNDGGGRLVVVEGVYSMEGDTAPLAEVVELCATYGARLMVDEAHSIGVLGHRGAGACEVYGVEEQSDLRMGTFSKSLASCGGFLAGSHEVIDYLRVSCRPFMFTASAVPAALGAARAALAIVRSEQGRRLAKKAVANARYLRRGLAELGFCVSLGDAPEVGGERLQTAIVPVYVGDDWRAAILWRELYDLGVFVNVAIHPAVPPGRALLRTSVMANQDEELLAAALERFASAKEAFEREHGPVNPREAHPQG